MTSLTKFTKIAIKPVIVWALYIFIQSLLDINGNSESIIRTHEKNFI